MQWRSHDASFLRFDTIPARDRETDTRTDGQTDTLWSLLPALALCRAGKKATICKRMRHVKSHVNSGVFWNLKKGCIYLLPFPSPPLHLPPFSFTLSLVVENMCLCCIFGHIRDISQFRGRGPSDPMVNTSMHEKSLAGAAKSLNTTLCKTFRA